MQENRFNSLDPILIPEWRWSYFLNTTSQAFSIFKPRPYPIENKYLIRESSFGSSFNPEKVFPRSSVQTLRDHNDLHPANHAPDLD